MMDTLARIKRLVVARQVQFTLKAETERLEDGLSVEDIIESVANATVITKTLRSHSTGRRRCGEKLFIIVSPNYSGLWIYTKGTIRKINGVEVFYVLISAKFAE